jgi:hypothetical protein
VRELRLEPGLSKFWRFENMKPKYSFETICTLMNVDETSLLTNGCGVSVCTCKNTGADMMNNLCTEISNHCTPKTNIYLLTFARCWHFQHTNNETNCSFGFVQNDLLVTNSCEIYGNDCEDFDGAFTIVDYSCTEITINSPKYLHLDYRERK